ncbi:hypothetical protein RJ639_009087, partial [Escallonia herrerae]
MERALKMYEHDPEVKLVILKNSSCCPFSFVLIVTYSILSPNCFIKGTGKAFCAGGDVVRMVHLVTAGHWSFSAAYYKRQLVLDYLLATYNKPLVFAMPEASIGHFPDVGASYFLSRLPGYYGEYLGLTGARIDGAEMVACGLATHFVLSKDLQSIENNLLAVPSSDTATIYEHIKKYINQARLNHGNYRKRLEIVNECFSKKTVEEILLSLENEVSRGADEWVAKAISSMKSASPTSLKIFLRSVIVITNASFISKN